MPLTQFQREVAQLLAANRTPDSHLAGAAALHLAPQSKRYSNDLDYFHDSAQRVAEAFAADQQTLLAAGCEVDIQMSQPGFFRTVVSREKQSTKVEWSHDSAWRFMPPLADSAVGYRLDPVDLAVNKLLALVGRNEPRDFLDTLWAHQEILSLGALCWAAVGKDPGFTPRSLLELVRRRGKYHQADFERLELVAPVNLPELKSEWLAALDHAERLVTSLPPSELGCLYYSRRKGKFVTPDPQTRPGSKDISPHYGRPGGVLPQVVS